MDDRWMRVGELSRRSGVPIATIKYYLREGLLTSGVATAANQADYSEGHLHRLRLIRALIDVGGVSVAGAREAIAAIETHADDPLELLGSAQSAIAPKHRRDRETADWQAARERVTALIAERGWLVRPDSPGIDVVADALAAGESLGVDLLVERLDQYADAAMALAGLEVGTVLNRTDPASRMELVVLGTVLGEALFSALRLLAHQHESARQLGRGRRRPT